jgi:phospho-N-acetylmuramoyl-pentapeptide-transferase
MTLRTAIITGAIAFVGTAAVGLALIPILRALKAGQSILEIGPKWHKDKEGTPTMGGLMFIIGMAAALIFAGTRWLGEGARGHIYILLFAVIYAVIGFLDDLTKLRHKRNLGLTALQKFFLQLAVAVLFVVIMRHSGIISSRFYIPFAGAEIMLPEQVYLPLAAFIIVGSVNAVNITDGVDGLATGVSIPAAVCCAAISLRLGDAESCVASAALAGALCGFFVFNRHPARVIMGDTGALFLGAALCALTFSMDKPLIIIPLGIVYIAETLSDIIQITYFKLTHGKRVFKMAPLHHHLELSGWSEWRITGVFTGISAVLAVITYFAVTAGARGGV